MAGGIPMAHIELYSNDGSITYTDNYDLPMNITFTVTADWANELGASVSADTFLGIATSANAAVPTYPVGTEVTVAAGESAIFYIVEGSASSRKSIDVATLSGWTSLPDGNHNITIVAKADGYRDSEPSAVVTVTKGQSTDPLAGTWVFNNTINFSALSTEDEFDFSWIVNYNVSDDSRDFVQMDTNRMSREDEEGNPILGGNINYIPYSTGIQEPIVAYQFEGDLSMWGSDSYKTIAITSKLSEVTNGDTLLKWLLENATKQ